MGSYNEDPVPIGDIVSPQQRANGETGNCQDCGAPGTWHSTPRGRRVFMEPRPVPAARVPLGKRWQIAEDGTAAVVDQPPVGHCRITHFDVCPARPRPAGGVLLGLWQKRRDAETDGK